MGEEKTALSALKASAWSYRVGSLAWMFFLGKRNKRYAEGYEVTNQRRNGAK